MRSVLSLHAWKRILRSRRAKEPSYYIVFVYSCCQRSKLPFKNVSVEGTCWHAWYSATHLDDMRSLTNTVPPSLLQQFYTNTRWAYTLVLIGKNRGGCLVVFLVLPRFTVSEAYRRKLYLRLQASSCVTQKAKVETRPSSSEDQTARAPGLNVVLGG